MNNFVNLLPVKHRRAALLRNLLTRWCTLSTVVIAVFVGVLWLDHSRHAKTTADLSKNERLCTPVIATAAANKRMRNQVRRFDHHETLVGQLRDDKPVLCFLTVVSNSARLCDGRLVVRDLHFQQQVLSDSAASRDVRANAGKEPAPLGPEAVLTIEGDALDNLAIARFAAALQDSSLFRDIELKSSVGTVLGDRWLHSFIFRCEI